LAFVLDGEVDERGGAPKAAAMVPVWKSSALVVPERHVEMGVDVDAARMTKQPVAS